jgi:hypothetical protein
MEQPYSSWLTCWLPRPLAALGLLLATAGAARAQSFNPAVTYGTGGSSSTFAVVGDLNGDGRPDIVASNYGSNTLSVLLQLASGGYAPAVTYSTGGTSPYDVTLGDVNGDGRLDAVVANFNSSTIAVLPGTGTGTGTFGTAAVYPTAGTNANPFGVRLGDINRDGRLDIVSSNAFFSGNGTAGAINVLLNTGSGTFGAATAYATGGSLRGLALADFNKDGLLDVVAASAQTTGNVSTNLLYVLLGQGSGFAPVVSYATGSTSYLVATGDVNRDGQLDIVFDRASAGNSVGVLTGKPDGTFNAMTTYAAGGTLAAGVALGDVNGDGRLDAVVGNYYGATADVLLGTSAGGFGAATPFAAGGAGTYTTALADLNADGKPDIVTANANASTVGVLLNQTVFAPTLTTINSTSGPVGTSVTLTGTNLTGATAVSFNGTAATTFSVVNATTLTATVPTGASSGNVTVTTPGGTSNGVAFTVTSIPPVLAGTEPSALVYVPSQGPKQITNSITVADADNPTLTGATVTIVAGLVPSQDALVFTAGSNFSSTYNAATGVLTLTGTAPLSTFQAALRAVIFRTTNTSSAVPGDRVVQFTVTDGTNTSNAVTRTVRVVAAPTVATATATSLTSTSAVLGGTVTADGGDAVTDRGVVYSSTNTLPTIGGAGVTQDANGMGVGSFAETIAGLLPGTTYYVRAYATNSAGTSYGSPVSFTTTQAPTSVVSISRVGSSPTNAGSVSYTVTFAAPVTGLSLSNFALATTGSVAGASLTSVSGSGTTYTVAVNTGTGDGTLGLNLVNAIGISPGLTNTLPFVGQVYTLDKTAPTVTITSPTAPNGGYTTTAPLTFVVTFSEAVMGYNVTSITSNVVNVAAGTLNSTTAPTYSLLLTPAAPGAVTLSVPAGIVTDAAGNANVAAVPPTYTIYYNVPTAAPVVTAPANNSTTPSNLPTYAGTAPAGSTVTVYVDGASIGTTTATGGTFNLVQPTVLTQGPHTVYATAQLIGQAVSATSNTNTFTVASAPTITLLSPATGPVGTQVTITGTNLSGATAVRFNGTAASSFVVNSATSITAVVAAGTTTGLVSVTTPSGTATSTTNFVVRVAPTTVADSYTTPQNVTLTGNVLSNDLGTNPVAILIIRPTHGTLALNPDGTFTYQPAAGYVGPDSFIYYACDPALPLLCGNPATVTINVVRVAPITVADSYSAPQNVTLTGNVLTNDIGTNPQAILIIRPTHGALLLNPDGTFTYQPAAGYTGPDSFIYYACNMGTPLVCGDPATVSITVTPATPSLTTTKPATTSNARGLAATNGPAAAQELALTGHPNPLGDELHLSFALPTAQAYTLALYDGQGRLVQQLASGQAEAGQVQELTVPTQTYATGLYLVRLTTATGTQLLKLIKQ